MMKMLDLISMEKEIEILVIEDDPAIAESLADGIGQQGYKVHWESTGNGGVAYAVKNADGATHLVFAASAAFPPSGLITADPSWSEGSPSFSPDGSLIVFGRFGTHSPTASGGIWIIGPNGVGLTNLATDGAYPRWLP